jgi:hypothetical protein
VMRTKTQPKVFSQLALCRNTVRSTSEPRRISPVSGRRSRSFWRARRACSCVILQICQRRF